MDQWTDSRWEGLRSGPRLERRRRGSRYTSAPARCRPTNIARASSSRPIRLDAGRHFRQRLLELRRRGQRGSQRILGRRRFRRTRISSSSATAPGLYCAYDFGDAPTSYGSAGQVLGNRTVYLGSVPPDGEAVTPGTPGSTASVDDSTVAVAGVDDEDGVPSFPNSLIVAGGTYTVPGIIVNNTSGATVTPLRLDRLRYQRPGWRHGRRGLWRRRRLLYHGAGFRQRRRLHGGRDDIHLQPHLDGSRGLCPQQLERHLRAVSGFDRHADDQQLQRRRRRALRAPIPVRSRTTCFPTRLCR